MQGTAHSMPDVAPLVDHVRPAIIWLGIASFFLGAIGVGATLAARQFGGAGPEPAAGMALLSLGVAYVGTGIVMDRTGSTYDPEIELPARQRALVAALAAPFLVVGLYELTTLVG